MNIYFRLLQFLLYRFDPETAHTLALNLLKISYQVGLLKQPNLKTDVFQVLGLNFPNQIGLAAGFDKNGDYIDALASLGFGFIEIGTITPKPQLGNPKPRLFRLTPDKAIINRLGFNNKGMEYARTQLEKIKYKGILGINIGKNKDTPNEKAIDDYVLCFRTLARYASYFTLNLSSPNTPNLRDLQHGELLKNLLSVMKDEQAQFFLKEKRYIPLVVKISPDLTQDELSALAEILIDKNIDAVIATNTTITRTHQLISSKATEVGGLSGQPLCARSTSIIRTLSLLLKNKIPIIASGGVMDKNAIKEKLQAGASLVQVYTGLIFNGPQILYP